MSSAVPAGYESSDDDDYEGDVVFANELRTVEKLPRNSSIVKKVQDDTFNATNDPIDWQSAIEGLDGNKSDINRTQDLTLHSAYSALNGTLTADASQTYEQMNLMCDDADLDRLVPVGQFKNYDHDEELDVSKVLTSQVGAKVFGDLELFLLSIDEDGLIELFEKHEITFKQLLTFREQDLINIGIDKVGLRKKILDGVAHLHTRKWQPSSLRDLSTKDLMTAPGIFLVLSDITKHIDYIGCTLSYLKHRLEADRETLEFGKEFVSVHKIIEELDVMTKQSKNTIRSMSKLKSYVKEISEDENLKPAHYLNMDFIRSIELEKHVFGSRTKILTSIIGVFFLYRMSNLVIKTWIR